MTWPQQHRCAQAPDENGGAALKCPMRNQTHPEGIGWDGKEESCKMPQYRCRLGCSLSIWVAFFSRQQRCCC